MKTIFRYIVDFFAKECSISCLTCIIILIAPIIYLNYNFRIESTVLASANPLFIFAWHYLLYTFVYAISFGLQRIFYPGLSFQRETLAFIFAAPSLFAFRTAFSLQEPLIRAYSNPEYTRYWLQTIGWLVRALVLIFSLYLFWKFNRKDGQPFYGMSSVKSIWPYFILLAMVIPLLLVSLSDKNLAAYYPRARLLFPIHSATLFHYVFFETCYGFDFLSIEIFFRGFLIVALASSMGATSILPMAAFYCTIHFAKPPMECISSFFGGILLGIIAYRTRSIWGGLVVHLGVAWSMEFAGLLLR